MCSSSSGQCSQTVGHPAQLGSEGHADWAPGLNKPELPDLLVPAGLLASTELKNRPKQKEKIMSGSTLATDTVSSSWKFATFTFLASNILFSKMYVMQFRTTSSLRALLAIMFPFLSTVSPVRTVRRHIHDCRKSQTLWARAKWGIHIGSLWYSKMTKLNIKTVSAL